MTIGNLVTTNNVFLAPLAGVSNRPYRILCTQQGAGLVYTEMVSAKAIAYKNKKTEQLLQISPDLETIGVQLFGRDPTIIAESAKRINHSGIALFDVNMGCPVPKIVNNGEGSALMMEPKRIGHIVEALVKAVEQPITIKIRSGFNKGCVNAVEVARIAESAGASAVTVHGRTREQFYTGKADWSVIQAVKEALTIPVIGNGDIFSAKDAQAMLETTHCDGVMVARGAQGNPWIFREINHLLETGEVLLPPTVKEVVEMIYRHKKALVKEKGPYVALRELRKHVAWYTKGMDNSAVLRKEMNVLEDMEGFDGLIETLLT